MLCRSSCQLTECVTKVNLMCADACHCCCRLLSRRFRSLGLWFVLRMYGTEKLQELVRHHIALGEWLAQQVMADSRCVTAYCVCWSARVNAHTVCVNMG